MNKIDGGKRTWENRKEAIASPLLFSIITVNFNGAATLEKTIESVIAQDCPSFEYILVDGGSTDKSLSIIKKYESKIDYWLSEPDKGIYDAMNKGVELAHGKLICFLNSDDQFMPNTLSQVEKAMVQNPDTGVFYGNVSFFDRGNPKKKEKVWKPNFIPKNVWRFTPVPHPCFFAENLFYKKFGSYNLNYQIAADADLMIKWQNKGIDFYYINKILARCDDSGISSTDGWYKGNFEIIKICLLRRRFLSIPGIIFRMIQRWSKDYFDKKKRE